MLVERFPYLDHHHRELPAARNDRGRFFYFFFLFFPSISNTIQQIACLCKTRFISVCFIHSRDYTRETLHLGKVIFLFHFFRKFFVPTLWTDRGKPNKHHHHHHRHAAIHSTSRQSDMMMMIINRLNE